MSSEQHPGSGSPEGGYSQPQDPWAGGYEPGMASVPTDPIPQQYDAYSQSYGSQPWSGATEVQGGPYGYVPQQPQRSRAPVFILVALLVLLFGGGAGVAAWYYWPRPGPQGQGNHPTTSASTTTTPPAIFDPQAVQEGQCLFNNGTDAHPQMQVVGCSTAQAYKVKKIDRGKDLPEGPDGKFDQSTATAVGCVGNGLYYYGYKDPVDDNKDLFFCMTKNP